MEAIILAGGLGTRLRPIVKCIPKPMAEVKGKPFLCYNLDYLSSYGIDSILLSVGYKYETITRYFGSKYKNSRIQYIIEEKPMGTGGAIQKALNLVRGRNVAILNGDSLFAVDLKKMLDFHIHVKSNLTLAVKPMRNFSRYGAVQLKGERIIGFCEKVKKKFGYINGGIYITDKSISRYFSPHMEKFSFEHDFLPKNLKKISPCAFRSDNFFIDIGIPEDYERAKRELAQFF